MRTPDVGFDDPQVHHLGPCLRAQEHLPAIPGLLHHGAEPSFRFFRRPPVRLRPFRRGDEERSVNGLADGPSPGLSVLATEVHGLKSGDPDRHPFAPIDEDRDQMSRSHGLCRRQKRIQLPVYVVPVERIGRHPVPASY